MSLFARLSPVLLLVASVPGQIPDGWYAFSAFGPKRGPIGVFTSHPRTAAQPLAITNLQGDLTVTGASCILYRTRDGALLVGERAPTNASVDLHVIHLNGLAVRWDASFSLGTGGPCCGEVAQMGLLRDERVVVAVTDVSAGPLKNYLTTSYGWQGVGIVDTASGLITPIQVTNGASIVDVFNGLAVAPDEQSVFLGTYVNAVQGDIWRVPIAGGVATRIASVPAGLSNLGFDQDGLLWVTTLDASNALFRIDVATGKVTAVPQTNGSLNGICLEWATGNFPVVSANAGQPPRSVFWMEPDGTHHLLANPGYGTLSGIAVNPDPEVIGHGTPGAATYSWRTPNPGGLPSLGNGSFSLTLDAAGSAQPGIALFATGRLTDPAPILGADLYLDPGAVVAALPVPAAGPRVLNLPIPQDPRLIGFPFFVQTFHLEGYASLSASPALEVSGL